MRRLLTTILSLFGVGCHERQRDAVPPELEPFEIREPSEVDVLLYIYSHFSNAVRPGVRTEELETLMSALLRQTAAEGYFKGYRDFPNFISASVNNEVLMTLPSSRELEEGDLFSIQTGVKFEGRYAYLGWTFPVGSISPRKQALISAAQNSLSAGLASIEDGALISDVSKAMDRVIRDAGYSPNAEFVGYQIGRQATMDPPIPCSFSPRTPTKRLKTGMTLAIIVILHEGEPACKVASDGWSVETADGSDSVLFSRLVRVDEGGCTILSDFS